MKNDVRFRTINVVEGSNVKGKITVASQPLPPNYFDLGFAFCGSQDLKSFNRKYGQMLALGRLTCDRTRVTIKKPADKTVFDAVKTQALKVAEGKGIKWMETVQIENLK
jgi:hypothetical protein